MKPKSPWQHTEQQTKAHINSKHWHHITWPLRWCVTTRPLLRTAGELCCWIPMHHYLCFAKELAVWNSTYGQIRWPWLVIKLWMTLHTAGVLFIAMNDQVEGIFGIWKQLYLFPICYSYTMHGSGTANSYQPLIICGMFLAMAMKTVLGCTMPPGYQV